MINKIMKLLALALLLITHTTFADLVDVQKFGSCCVVMTYIDDFTDEKNHILRAIGEGNDIGSHNVILGCRTERSDVLFQAGIQLHIEGPIKVRYRFDKKALIEETWRWNGDVAGKSEEHDEGHDAFMQELTQSKKLIFQVGDNQGSVDLNGSAAAVAEYKKRCAASGY